MPRSGRNPKSSTKATAGVGSDHTLPVPQLNDAQDEAYKRELFAVNVAISVNTVIFFAKLYTAAISGSSSLLAEAVHSAADVCNQGLLWLGVTRSTKLPTVLHPYGFGRDKFVWSLISAVGIFCCGAGVSVVQGINGILAPHPVENLYWGFVVLGVSAVLESISLAVAVRAVMAGARAAGMGFLQYVRTSADPTSVAIMMEDGGAVAGLVVAAVGMGLAHHTGNVVFDSVGSIVVGVLLGAIAVFLIQRNRSMLIGRSMDRRTHGVVMEHLRGDPVIRAVYDAKSEELGPGIFRFKAEIDFSGDSVVERYLQRNGKQQLLRQVQTAAARSDPEQLEEVLSRYGTGVVSAVGEEVDRIESELTQMVPSLRYVDLETDRGRGGKGAASSWPDRAPSADDPFAGSGASNGNGADIIDTFVSDQDADKDPARKL